ncbi:TPA-induced transmembrane protein homolog [Amia ocellicauda]|uniref:TPA-induced transmembrane protein homolog n=1 Tax=Amia ocellicauda TaxID=2972642 RepID=UPI0034647C16
MSAEGIELQPLAQATPLQVNVRIASEEGSRRNVSQTVNELEEVTEGSLLVSNGENLNEQEVANNGAQSSTSTAAEANHLLQDYGQVQNGQQGSLNHGKRRCPSANEVVFWKCKLWMVILVIIVLLIATTAISLFLYSVVYEDEDDKFDKGSFMVPRYYSGALRLVNKEFTEELLSPESQASQSLSTYLKEMLSGLYSSSPALGRYFSEVGMQSFSNGSVTAHYWLKFMIPTQHVQLDRYTLSEEVVLNIFRQHLYDQELETEQQLHIDPLSVSLKAANRSVISAMK